MAIDFRSSAASPSTGPERCRDLIFEVRERASTSARAIRGYPPPAGRQSATASRWRRSSIAATCAFPSPVIGKTGRAGQLLRSFASPLLSVRLSIALVALLWAAPIMAQGDGVRLEIAVNPATALQEGPTITSANLLADENTRELLRNGFATRIHYRL